MEGVKRYPKPRKISKNFKAMERVQYHKDAKNIGIKTNEKR
jgi:hypothetical protein